MPDLKNKIAIVTGSTSGIGRGIAEHFASLGAKVVVSGRDEARGETTVRGIVDRGGHAAFRAVDLTDEVDCRGLIHFAVNRFGGLDILVSNAADTSRGGIEDATTELWDRIMKVNLRAPFILLQESIAPMKLRGGGTVVHIGSVNAYIGEPKLLPYSVSKGGLMTLTKNAASSLARHRIRVNQLNVGWTLTEGEEKVKRLEGKGPEWVDEAIASRPFGALMVPLDIAHAVAYFASDDSRLVSGTVMDLEQYPVGAPPNW